jgi:hypothetical protein
MKSGIKRRNDLLQRPQFCGRYHPSRVSMVRNEVASVFYSWSLRARAISGIAEYTTEFDNGFPTARKRMLVVKRTSPIRRKPRQ